MRFKEKVALITGSSRGIGKELAKGFAREGAQIVLHGRDRERLKEAAKEFEVLGAEYFTVSGDVSSSQDVSNLVRETVERFGRIDILVNNAGVNPFILEAEKIREEGWDEVIRVNLKGVFLCCQAVGRKMIERGGGTILNMASAVGFLGEQGFLPYSVSKAGVMMMTRVLAYEWSRYHIRVNAIAPGFIAAGMNTPVLKKESLVSALAQRVPLKRLGRAEEIVQIALFLASDEASYVNGTTVVADGGMTGYNAVSFLDLIAEMRKKG